MDSLNTQGPEGASRDLPPFYRNPVALNKEAHAAMTIGTSPSGYRFAASSQTALLAAVEFFDAGRQFPIIFAPGKDRRVLPVALFGLEKDENLFVDAKGGWLGQYVPAYVRRYPFITTDGAEGRVTVCFDEVYDGLNREEGARLFEDGAPTAKLKEIEAFLQDFIVRIKHTERFTATLAKAGLFKPITALARLNDGRSYALEGMLVVDEQKLARLPDVDIVRLFRSGAMALIHAHLLSLRNLNLLMDLKAGKAA